MQQNDWFCNQHPQPINKICIDHHQCKDRRLCIDCIIDNHQQIRKQRMPSTQEFLNILNNKLKYFKEDDYRGFVKTIEALQGKVKLEFNNLKKLTKSVIETITLGDQQILKLKAQLTKRPLLEFSRGDYDFMKDIIEGNILEHRLFWRKKCKTICEEQFQGLQDNLQLIIDEVQMMTEETICEFRSFIGKHIKYYFQIKGIAINLFNIFVHHLYLAYLKIALVYDSEKSMDLQNSILRWKIR